MNPFTGKEYSETAKKERLKIASLPAADPIVLKKLDDIYATCNVILVKAETGAGKGAVIAPHILELEPDAKVVVTEPRTVNTHVAEYLRIIMDAPIVDYGYRFNNNIKASTRLAFVTDGFLLNFFYKLPFLSSFSPLRGEDDKKGVTSLRDGEFDYQTIIIDEAHERNKNIDQLMAFCRDLVAHTKKKLVLMSATIDLPFYEKYFSSPKIGDGKVKVGKIEISGRSYPVEHIFLTAEDDYVDQAAKLIIADIFPPGDILIFLNSANELKKACKQINAKAKFACYELHKGTNLELRHEIISESAYKQKFKAAERKIIFSTNVAESGITIDGVKIVIDCGQRYESIFRPEDEMYELARTFISKAEIQQRAGRAGRTAPGTCYHLYSEEDYNKTPDYKAPEMEKEELSDMILQLLNAGIDLDFLQKLPTPPHKNQIAFGLKLLRSAHLSSSPSSFSQSEKEGNGEKGAQSELEELTDLGREVAKLPLNWQEAVCLLKAKFLRVEGSLCKILAMLSVAPNINDLFTNVSENSPKYGEYKRKMYNWENAAGEIFAMKIMLEKFLEAGDRGMDWCNSNYLQGSKFINAKKLFYKLLGNAKELNNISFWRGRESEQSEHEKKKITLALEEGFALNIATRKSGEIYTVQRPCGTVKVEKSPFIKKIGKRILFLDIRKINGEPKISSIVNLSNKKLSS